MYAAGPSAGSDNGEGPQRLPLQTLGGLWARLAAFYGEHWTNHFGADPGGVTGQAWGAGLADVTPAQLAEGLRALAVSASPWPPTLPEFRARCFGIPSFSEVAEQLRPGHPSPSPFVKLVWRYVDPWALRNADARAERAMMRDGYEAAARYVMQGGSLDAPALFHDPSVERELYDALHRKRMAELLRNSEVAADGKAECNDPHSLKSGNV